LQALLTPAFFSEPQNFVVTARLAKEQRLRLAQKSRSRRMACFLYFYLLMNDFSKSGQSADEKK